VTITVSTTNSRDRDALIYFLNSDKWQHRVTLRSGRKVYGIPSRTSAGLFHLTDGAECSCKDWTTRQPEGGCAHMRAAVLYRMEKAAQQSRDKKQAPNRYAALFGQDDDKPWCTPCARHHAAGEHYGRRAS
jgi:hypothetical protein